jgi:hypothetical protein
MPYPSATAAEKGLALGTVIYDALLLALCLQVRQDRPPGKDHLPGTDFNAERQSALELMVVKCRGLDEFLMSSGKHRDDVLASEFRVGPREGYVQMASVAAPAVDLRDAANKRTAHLTWTRVREWPPKNWDDLGLEKYARELLKELLLFVSTTLTNGAKLAPEHEGKWQALQAVCAAVC